MIEIMVVFNLIIIIYLYVYIYIWDIGLMKVYNVSLVNKDKFLV